MGFVAQKRFPTPTDFIVMTPGVHLDQKGDGLGQQYRSVREVIIEESSDVIIVGRAIYAAKNPLTEAKRYRRAGQML
jgi:orotidine-5'-phosphate decarboxylase